MPVRKSSNCNHNPPVCMKQLFHAFILNLDGRFPLHRLRCIRTFYWSETSLYWYADDTHRKTGTNSQDVPNATQCIVFQTGSIPNPRDIFQWLPSEELLQPTCETEYHASHLLRADFYYGGFDNGVMPPTFQMAIDATVVTNISSSLNAEYSYQKRSVNPRHRDRSPPPPRFKQLHFLSLLQ